MRSTWLTAKTMAANLQAEIKSAVGSAEISIFHDFSPPPTGGGHQFLRSLMSEFIRLGYTVENNALSKTALACLFNSNNFHPQRLRRLRSHRMTCRMIHRVDGPLSAYRGSTSEVDKSIWALNQEFANATIFQSQYSLNKHLEMGLRFIDPNVILNAADPAIFHPRQKSTFDPHERIRIISTSWSDNPNKGEASYGWLDQHLDWNRYSFTFVGRIRLSFQHIQHISPVSPHSLADLLRASDLYLTASQNDPCSNALIEGLSCGLPAIYLNSGGHPEIVGRAGLAFERVEEIPDLLERLCEQYERYQQSIHMPGLTSVAQLYLKSMGYEPAQEEQE